MCMRKEKSASTISCIRFMFVHWGDIDRVYQLIDNDLVDYVSEWVRQSVDQRQINQMRKLNLVK